MRLREILTAVAAGALVMAPTAASAANPAAKLSVSKSARASADGKNASSLFGMSGWVPVILIAIVAAGSIIALTNGDDDSVSP